MPPTPPRPKPSTVWRERGQQHYDAAKERPGDDPMLNALLAIYCELRQSSNDAGDQAAELKHLAGAIRTIAP